MRIPLLFNLFIGINSFTPRYQSRKILRTLSKHVKSKNDIDILRETQNITNLDTSTIRADEVSSFGMCTALADEHIRLGNFEEARKLAEEAMEIGKHT